eukprot:scaffold2154_cov37-Tisochrysis_lutea.AAC.3
MRRCCCTRGISTGVVASKAGARPQSSSRAMATCVIWLKVLRPREPSGVENYDSHLGPRGLRATA